MPSSMYAQKVSGVIQRDRSRLKSIGARTMRELAYRVAGAVYDAVASGRDPVEVVHAHREILEAVLAKTSITSHAVGRGRTGRALVKRIKKKKLLAIGSLYDNALKQAQSASNLTGDQLKEIEAKYGKHVTETVSRWSDAVSGGLAQTMRDIVAKGLHAQDAMAEVRSSMEAMGMSPTSPHLLETMVRDQIGMAYMAGKLSVNEEDAVQEILWGYEYVTVRDDRVRLTHEALDGVRLPKDDPRWQKIMPPNGFNCRCDVIEIFNDQAALATPNPPKEMAEVDGVMVKPGPDKGWDFNPGSLFSDIYQITEVPRVEEKTLPVKPAELVDKPTPDYFVSSSEFPLAGQGALPLRIGADWIGLKDPETKDFLLQRAARKSEFYDPDTLIKEDAVREMLRITTEDRFRLPSDTDAFFGIGASWEDILASSSGEGGILKFDSTRTMTTDPSRAKDYAQGGTIFSVTLPAGTHAAAANVFGLDELQLMPGSSYSVGSVERRDGVTRVSLVLIEDGAANVAGIARFKNELALAAGKDAPFSGLTDQKPEPKKEAVFAPVNDFHDLVSNPNPNYRAADKLSIEVKAAAARMREQAEQPMTTSKDIPPVRRKEDEARAKDQKEWVDRIARDPRGPELVSSIRAYTDASYDIKEFQSTGQGPDWVRETSANLVEVLKSAPLQSGTFHRGMSLHPKDIERLKNAKSLTTAAVTSMSSEEEIAAEFAQYMTDSEDENSSSVQVYMHFKTSRAIDISKISTYQEQEERVLQKGETFNIAKTKERVVDGVKQFHVFLEDAKPVEKTTAEDEVVIVVPIENADPKDVANELEDTWMLALKTSRKKSTRDRFRMVDSSLRFLLLGGMQFSYDFAAKKPTVTAGTKSVTITATPEVANKMALWAKLLDVAKSADPLAGVDAMSLEDITRERHLLFDKIDEAPGGKTRKGLLARREKLTKLMVAKSSKLAAPEPDWKTVNLTHFPGGPAKSEPAKKPKAAPAKKPEPVKEEDPVKKLTEGMPQWVHDYASKDSKLPSLKDYHNADKKAISAFHSLRFTKPEKFDREKDKEVFRISEAAAALKDLQKQTPLPASKSITRVRTKEDETRAQTPAEWADKLAEQGVDAVDAVKHYTLDQYAAIRAIQAGIPKDQWHEKARKWYDPKKTPVFVKELEKALQSAPLSTTTVHRGMKLSQEDAAKLLAGTTLETRAIASTSSDEKQASRFASQGAAKDDVRVIMDFDTSRAISIEKLSGIEKEKEYLLEKGLKFKYEAVVEKEGPGGKPFRIRLKLKDLDAKDKSKNPFKMGIDKKTNSDEDKMVDTTLRYFTIS